MQKSDSNKIKKIGIICSPGGHLDQALSVLDAFRNCDLFIVSYNFPSLKNFNYEGIKKIYLIKYFGDSYLEVFITLLVSIFSYFKIFFKERPNILFSTGSEIAIPAFYVGKFIFKSKLIYLESYVRTIEPNLTAKFVYRICDLFLVQHVSLLSKFGKKAKYSGSII